MKKPDNNPSKNRLFWIVCLAAWIVLFVCCILSSFGVIPVEKSSAFLYLSCAVGLVSSVINLIRSK